MGRVCLQDSCVQTTKQQASTGKGTMSLRRLVSYCHCTSKGTKIASQRIRKLRLWTAFFVALTFGIVLGYHVYLARMLLFSRTPLVDTHVTTSVDGGHRAVLPHVNWVDDTDRWREAYPAELYVYTAFYYYKRGVSFRDGQYTQNRGVSIVARIMSMSRTGCCSDHCPCPHDGHSVSS